MQKRDFTTWSYDDVTASSFSSMRLRDMKLTDFVFDQIGVDDVIFLI